MKKLFRILPLALVIAAGSALADVPKNLKIGTDPTYASLFKILCKCLSSEVTVKAVTELDNKATHCHTPSL